MTAKNKGNSSSKSLKKFFHLVLGSEEMYMTALVSFFCAFFTYKWMVGLGEDKIRLILIAMAVFSGVFLLAFFVGYSRYLNGSNFLFRKEKEVDTKWSEMDERLEEMKEDNRWRQNESADRDREHGH